MGTPRDSEKTRAKLIEAAGPLFAEKGFNGVTVREIVRDADTHLSALNYHFRTKESLYREVLLEACKADSISVRDQNLLLGLEPRKALYVLVKESLKEYNKKAVAGWKTTVITRECRQPSELFEDVAREYFQPQTGFIARIIGKAVDQPADSHPVRFAVISMIGLVETFGLYQHLIDAVAPGLTEHYSKKDGMTKQIVQLVLEAANPGTEHQPA